jgi:hypothetical protein
MADWWRTQHPGPVLSIRGADGRMHHAMQAMIYQNWLALLLAIVPGAILTVALRFQQEEVRREIDSPPPPGLLRLASRYRSMELLQVRTKYPPPLHCATSRYLRPNIGPQWPVIGSFL